MVADHRHGVEAAQRRVAGVQRQPDRRDRCWQGTPPGPLAVLDHGAQVMVIGELQALGCRHSRPPRSAREPKRPSSHRRPDAAWPTGALPCRRGWRCWSRQTTKTRAAHGLQQGQVRPAARRSRRRPSWVSSEPLIPAADQVEAVARQQRREHRRVARELRRPVRRLRSRCRRQSARMLSSGVSPPSSGMSSLIQAIGLTPAADTHERSLSFAVAIVSLVFARAPRSLAGRIGNRGHRHVPPRSRRPRWSSADRSR